MHYDKDTNKVNVTLELAGLQKEDVSIDVHNNALTVSGEDNTSSKLTESGYVIRERCYGKFSRSSLLPQGLKVSTSVIPYDDTAAEILMTFRAEQGYQGVNGKWRFDYRLSEVNT